MLPASSFAEKDGTFVNYANLAQAIRWAVRPLHAEGQAESGWVLLDYGDVLMHVFLEDTRAYYALERLWGDAPLLSMSSAEDGA